VGQVILGAVRAGNCSLSNLPEATFGEGDGGVRSKRESPLKVSVMRLIAEVLVGDVKL
jgi:hypothetical protein